MAVPNRSRVVHRIESSSWIARDKTLCKLIASFIKKTDILAIDIYCYWSSYYLSCYDMLSKKLIIREQKREMSLIDIY